MTITVIIDIILRHPDSYTRRQQRKNLKTHTKRQSNFVTRQTNKQQNTSLLQLVSKTMLTTCESKEILIKKSNAKPMKHFCLCFVSFLNISSVRGLHFERQAETLSMICEDLPLFLI